MAFTKVVDKFYPAPFCWLSAPVPYHIFIVRSGIWISDTEGGGRIMIFLQLRINILFSSMYDFCSTKSLPWDHACFQAHMLYADLFFAEMPFTKL